MTDEQSILKSCIADPGDNTARLAYADYLAENDPNDSLLSRIEWIRKFCVRKTYSATRQPGEPAWIRDNFYRLWPNLTRRIYDGSRWKKTIQSAVVFLTGRIQITLSVPIPTRIHDQGTVVTLYGERGILHTARVTFLRAAWIAPLVALDEPNIDFEFHAIPPNVFSEFGYTSVRRGLFDKRGLGGVFDGLANGFQFPDSNDVAYRDVGSSPQMADLGTLVFYGKWESSHSVATHEIHASLTRWAHQTARNLTPVTT